MGVVSETRLEEMRLEKEHVQAQLESALQSLEGSRAEAQVRVRVCVRVWVCVCVRAWVCVRGWGEAWCCMCIVGSVCFFNKIYSFSTLEGSGRVGNE